MARLLGVSTVECKVDVSLVHRGLQNKSGVRLRDTFRYVGKAHISGESIGMAVAMWEKLANLGYES